MTRKHRIVAMLICICFVLISAFSLLYVLQEAQHDCIGNNCPVCAFLHVVSERLRTLSLTCNAFLFMFSVFTCLYAVLSALRMVCPHTSPVSQKVRMNN